VDARGDLLLLGARSRPLGDALHDHASDAHGDDRPDFRNFMETFLQYAGNGLGKAFNSLWSFGMFLGPVVAMVFLWDDPGSASFVLTAIGFVIVTIG
jgi:hypothetical protein